MWLMLYLMLGRVIRRLGLDCCFKSHLLPHSLLHHRQHSPPLSPPPPLSLTAASETQLTPPNQQNHIPTIRTQEISIQQFPLFEINIQNLCRKLDVFYKMIVKYTFLCFYCLEVEGANLYYLVFLFVFETFYLLQRRSVLKN